MEHVIGVVRRARLELMAEGLLAQAEVRREQSGQKQCLFEDLRYAANTWVS